MTERRQAIVNLIQRMIAQSRVIAKGNRIRDVQRLVETSGLFSFRKGVAQQA